MNNGAPKRPCELRTIENKSDQRAQSLRLETTNEQACGGLLVAKSTVGAIVRDLLFNERYVISAIGHTIATCVQLYVSEPRTRTR